MTDTMEVTADNPHASPLGGSPSGGAVAILPAPQSPPEQDVIPSRKRPENILSAIAAVTRAVGIVPKAGVNQFHRYRYATMQDVLQRLTPLLGEHGIIIFQTEIGRAMFDEDRVVSVQYEFTIAHTSGEVWPEKPKQTGVCRCRDSKGGWDDKSLNKCHTAARKYFLLALFQIATGEEDDADDGRTEGHRPQASPNVMVAPIVHAADSAPAAGAPEQDFPPPTLGAPLGPEGWAHNALGTPLGPEGVGAWERYALHWTKLIAEANTPEKGVILRNLWNSAGHKYQRQKLNPNREQLDTLMNVVASRCAELKSPDSSERKEHA